MRQRWIVVLVIAVGCGLLPRPVWSASSTGEDTTPPTFTIGFPARGDFVSGSAEVTIQGTATDGQSGVASIEVNGQRAVLSGTAWSIPATLAFGLNIFTLQVTDQAGNVASTSWSALYSPTYLPAGERLSEGALSRIGPVVLEQIVSSGTIQQALIGAAGTSRGPFRIDSLTFGTPSVTVTLDQGGFQATIDIPNLIITGGVGRARLEFSTDATIDGVLVVSVTNGAFVASMPSPPTVTLSRLTRRKGPLPRPILKLLENALATALQTTLPPAVATALNEASGPHTRSWLGTIVSFEFTPRRIAIDAQNVQVTFDAHVTAASDPQIPASPGSVSRGQGAPPVLTGVHDVAVSVREDFVNQILHAAWHAGAGRVWIDRSHLATYGISLPFPLDATFLVPFFPALAALNPAGQPMPIAFDLNPALPPVFRITGAPDLATMSVGELRA